MQEHKRVQNKCRSKSMRRDTSERKHLQNIAQSMNVTSASLVSLNKYSGEKSISGSHHSAKLPTSARPAWEIGAAPQSSTGWFTASGKVKS